MRTHIIHNFECFYEKKTTDCRTKKQNFNESHTQNAEEGRRVDDDIHLNDVLVW